MSQTVQAAQITDRSLNISNSIPSATGVTYTFNFTPGTSSVITSMTLQGCTTPVGTCTAPGGLNIGSGTPTLTNFQSISSVNKNTTLTTPVDCTISADLCLDWSGSTAQTTTNHTVTVTGATNPSALGTFFIRIVTYTAAGGLYTVPEDNGNVASATTQSITASATIQEQLTFCVGAVNGDSSTVETTSYSLSDCTGLTGSSLSLGTLSGSAVSVSPMATTQPYNGDLNNGVLELNTNAANGSAISYDAVQQSGTNHQGALRVAGATCASGSSYTDQCINSVGVTAAQIVPGTEDFGMAVVGDNCTNVPVSAYTCNATTHSLTPTANYECDATDATTSFSSFDTGGQVGGTTTCSYAWDETGTQENVATSTGVVAGEGLIFEFAATPELTTPTGSYTAEANFVATPTY